MFNLRNLILRVEEELEEKPLTLKPYATGTHHKTFSVTLRDGSEYFVRVRTPSDEGAGNSGRVPHHDFFSEFGTVNTLFQLTNIPVPCIVACGTGDDKDTDVGAEWIVENSARGIPLAEAWPGMSREQRERASVSIAEIWAELLKLHFDQVGTLYPNNELDSPRHRYGPAFIGALNVMPGCNTCRMQTPPVLHSGPFSSTRDWLISLATHEQDLDCMVEWTTEQFLQMRAVATKITDCPVLQMDEILPEPLCNFVLKHSGLHSQNIRVDNSDPTKITAVLGWEGAQILPMFAVEPQFPEDLEFDCSEEQDALTQIMFDTIALRVPDWNLMENETARELRHLYLLARHSYCYRDLGYRLD